MHHNPASGLFVVSNNYFRRGPSASMTPFFLDAENVGEGLGYYFESNYIDDPEHYIGVLSPWVTTLEHPSLKYLCSYFKGADCESYKLNTRPDFNQFEAYLQPVELSYKKAYSAVLKGAGAFPRDKVTRTSIDDVIGRTGEWGARIPDNLMDGLQIAKVSLDTDNDGLPDDWEIKNGLDSNNPNDQHAFMPSGYYAIEQYINELAEELIKRT
jgi:hypothetical protein